MERLPKSGAVLQPYGVSRRWLVVKRRSARQGAQSHAGKQCSGWSAAGTVASRKAAPYGCFPAAIPVRSDETPRRTRSVGWSRSYVDGSWIAAIGYDPATQILEVELKPARDGTVKIYQYRPVTPDVHAEMIDPANSVGKLVNVLKNDPTVFETQIEPT